MTATEKAFFDAAMVFCIAQHNFDVASAPGGWTCGPAGQFDPAPAKHLLMIRYVALRKERGL